MCHMEKTNALQLRQNLKKIFHRLKKTGGPILVERGREPIGVLLSLEEYQKRFVDVEADEKRKRLVEHIRGAQLQLPSGKSSLDLIRELRR